MNTLVRIQGYVSKAYILKRFKKYAYEPKYKLSLIPHNPHSFFLIETMVAEIKREYELQESYSSYCRRMKSSTDIKDRIFDNDEIIFESLHSPTLENKFSLFTTDDEFTHKFVQVVGHIQIQELGNCFLSFHILEPAVHPAHGWDD